MKEYLFTFSALKFAEFASELNIIWISSIFSSPSGRGEVNSSATSVVASSNIGKCSAGCLYNLSARASSKLAKSSMLISR